MNTYRLVLIGFGNVGKAFARLLLTKQPELFRKYGLTFRVIAIGTHRHGSAIDPQGIDLEEAIHLVDTNQPLNILSREQVPDNMLDFIRACPGDVLLENTPVNHQTGQPAIDHIRVALEEGMHAITANKGPVAIGFRDLAALAERQKRKFYFESSVMDGAPIFSLFRSAMPGAQLKGFSGILNSCTNMILTRMETGETLDQAVAYGQSIGITETDPSADIDGWDASIKVAALANVLMGVPILPQNVDREGIRSITPEKIAEARAEGKRWKLICSAGRQDGRFFARVHPEKISPESPCYSINGTSSYVQFETDVLPGLGIVESDPSPETTAFGLLADLINVARE